MKQARTMTGLAAYRFMSALEELHPVHCVFAIVTLEARIGSYVGKRAATGRANNENTGQRCQYDSGTQCIPVFHISVTQRFTPPWEIRILASIHVGMPSKTIGHQYIRLRHLLTSVKIPDDAFVNLPK